MPLEFLDTDIQAIAEAPFRLRPGRGISSSSKSRQIIFLMLRTNTVLTCCPFFVDRSKPSYER